MTGFDFTGVFDVTNGEYTPFYMSFEIDPCGYSYTCDFRDTDQVSLALPTGVSYTSDIRRLPLIANNGSAGAYNLGVAAARFRGSRLRGI